MEMAVRLFRFESCESRLSILFEFFAKILTPFTTAVVLFANLGGKEN